MSTIDHDAHHDDAMSHGIVASSSHPAGPPMSRSQATDAVAADAMARLHEILNGHREINHERFGSVTRQIETIGVALQSDLAAADASAAAAKAQAVALDFIRIERGADPTTVGNATALLHAQTIALLELDVAVHARAEVATREAMSLRTATVDGSAQAHANDTRANLLAAMEGVDRLTSEMRALVENHSNRPQELIPHYSSTTPFAVSPEGVVTLFVAPDQKDGAVLAKVGEDQIRVTFERTTDGHVTWKGDVNGQIHPAESRHTQSASERMATPHSDHGFTYTVFKTVPERENKHSSQNERIVGVRGGGELNGTGLVREVLLEGLARVEALFEDKTKTADVQKERHPVDQTEIAIVVRLEPKAPDILRGRR